MLRQIVLLASWSEPTIEPSTATGILGVTRGTIEGKGEFFKGGEEAW